MAVREIENSTDAATEHWSVLASQSDQTNPVTRRVSLDAHLGELETLEIERNAEFHATIVRRLADPADLIDSDKALSD